jgi:signal transduction histidine kinase
VEIDRAKTTFFSNVSHEFRTPLTLILGPIEDALAQPTKSLDGENLQAVHRSALRLLSLVNSLLDFAHRGRPSSIVVRINGSLFIDDRSRELIPVAHRTWWSEANRQL